MDPQQLLHIDTSPLPAPTSTTTTTTLPSSPQPISHHALAIDVIPEKLPFDLEQWKGLERMGLMGGEFRMLHSHKVLVWEPSALSIEQEYAATQGATHVAHSLSLTVVVAGMEDGWMIAVRYDQIPHWFEWCRVRKSFKKRLPHIDVSKISSTDSSLKTTITLQEKSLSLLRSLGVKISMDPEEGFVFNGRKVAGAEEIARVLLEDAVKRDDPELLHTVHYTLVHSRLLYLSRGHIAKLLIAALPKKTLPDALRGFVCSQYAKFGERAIIAMADIDANQPALYQLLQQPLCAHKQDLRDGMLVS